ncbi:acyl-CoA dehydrogenase family protein [Modestobacter roseus]|uniref:Alkylation response protein AidB-like acyl-CoA dehydrogenase n=1 Tax=Modestobacter roseus TaxID=1181884 RepID=A0A562IPF0_9ACTN|nr:acyl-CoA dehydrogenase family protein [Modestobacter roseus]MQA35377.1 acyl-CoA dehydrogenase [Modestobacter roseus]TWH72772.1 alkylation response protein AidB-like acyl-CoA dehydrogenase [Modestobacter roseus]
MITVANPPGPELLTRVTAVVTETIAPAAATVDATGSFPREGIDALARAGALGLLSAPEVGGAGGTLADVAQVVEQVAAADGSTGMVLLMHYAATAALEAHGPEDVRRAVARGEHLSTLAFSESGSRSHFWTPLGSAAADGDRVRLDAAKSWVTSAGEADSYVWSSRPLAAPGPMTLWLVPSDTPEVTVAGDFDGVGLRGNSSRPVRAAGALVPASAQLGPDGAGLDIALGTVLPTFLVGNAAFSLGLMEALLADAVAHLTRTRLEHLGVTLAEQPLPRAEFARLKLRVDGVRAFLADTLAALGAGRPDATLRVLEVKAVAAEAAAEVADGVMRLCGGAAFRKELGVERRFRDSLAARVMAPTTAALHDFVGRLSLGLPLFDAAADQDGAA